MKRAGQRSEPCDSWHRTVRLSGRKQENSKGKFTRHAIRIRAAEEISEPETVGGREGRGWSERRQAETSLAILSHHLVLELPERQAETGDKDNQDE